MLWWGKLRLLLANWCRHCGCWRQAAYSNSTDLYDQYKNLPREVGFDPHLQFWFFCNETNRTTGTEHSSSFASKLMLPFNLSDGITLAALNFTVSWDCVTLKSWWSWQTMGPGLSHEYRMFQDKCGTVVIAANSVMVGEHGKRGQSSLNQWDHATRN